jgi:hypothetical protein
MSIWNRLTDRFSAKPDLLGFADAATPTADEWLTAFTLYFMQNPGVEHGVRGLMAGLRFFTAQFVAEIAALPPVESQRSPVAGSIPKAIYTATAPIVVGVYQNSISRKAGRGDIQAAFTQAAPRLMDEYNRLLH